MADVTSTETHSSFYSKAYFYDLAFGFKDLASENGTLSALYENLNGRKASSFLDIAAGPARNAIAMHREFGLKAYAVDYSPEMVRYGLELAADSHTPLTYLQGDMRNFQLDAPVDLAAMFMASTGYLLSNEDMIEHLRCVARNLSPKGLYILEMTHPRDVFGVGSSTSQVWNMLQDNCEVSVEWGVPEDPSFDPITQTRQITARLTYTTPVESGEIVDRAAQREFSFQEMRALVALSGAFEWVTTLGAWDLVLPLSNEASAWRMIPVLQKR